MLSQWLFANPDVLILDEPTRGIDVGAKYEIYTIINKLADEGKGILVISSEMPELLGISDRIYVMNEGRIVGEMPASEASQEKIMRAIVRGEGKGSIMTTETAAGTAPPAPAKRSSPMQGASRPICANTAWCSR